jgi:hypothetical protein
MKKLYLFLLVLLGFLITACATMPPVYAQHDFDAFLGNTISDNDIDGAIGSEWDDAGNYTNIAIDPQGTAEVWTKHDGTYLYMAVRFTADSDNPWVSFLFARALSKTVPLPFPRKQNYYWTRSQQDTERICIQRPLF